jgi:acyl carrier protein
MKQNLKQDIITILNEKLDIKLATNELSDETSIQDLGVSSMLLVKMVYLIEDQLGVKLATNDILLVETLGDLLELLESKLDARAIRA